MTRTPRGDAGVGEKPIGDPNQPGVYEISTPTVSDFLYYGSAARSIKRRWATHKYELKNERHGNRWLQAVVRKYGLSVVVFRVVENCDPLHCLAREQFHIDKCPLERRFNLSPIAGSRLGARLTEEQKRRIAERRGGIGSAEVLSQIVAEYEAGAKQSDLSKKFGVDPASIRNYLRAKGAKLRLQPTRDVRLQQLLGEEYATGKTIRQLAAEHRLDYDTVFRMLRDSGVRLRSNSRRQRLRFLSTESRRAHSRAKNGRAYRFVHRIHGEFVGYPFEFAKKFGLRSSGNIFQVIHGRRPAYCGWEIAEEGKNHEWKCPESGRLRKLTPFQVKEVRQLLGRGVTQKAIAAKYSIDPSSISRIKTGAYRYSHGSAL